jgi:hypothetical protein
MLFTSTMPTHAEKNRGRRVLFPLKRAHMAAICLSTLAACMIAQLVQPSTHCGPLCPLMGLSAAFPCLSWNWNNLPCVSRLSAAASRPACQPQQPGLLHTSQDHLLTPHAPPLTHTELQAQEAQAHPHPRPYPMRLLPGLA